MDYVPRLADETLREMVAEHPAVLIVGPRATGKTTSARRLAASYVDLSTESQGAVFAADADAALLGRPEPVLLDEWQAVPSVLGAVKRAVDRDPRPGRFIITGSARAELDGETWPGTGRLVRLTMEGLTERERRRGIGAPLTVDRIAAGTDFEANASPPTLRDYVELAAAGGFPEPALRLSGRPRERWWDSYVDQLVTRDARELEPRRDAGRLRRYLEAYALHSAGIVDETTLLTATGLNRRTADAYRQLLQDLYVVDEIPAWTSNRLRRLSLPPKRYVVDTGLLLGALGADVLAVMNDANLLGRLLDTFVTQQVRAELPHLARRARLFHLRQQDGRHEVDLLIELGGSSIVAIEVRATSAPALDDAKHLIWLRDRIGDAFIAGVVFHTGPRPFELTDKIRALPISAFWT